MAQRRQPPQHPCRLLDQTPLAPTPPKRSSSWWAARWTGNVRPGRCEVDRHSQANKVRTRPQRASHGTGQLSG